MKAILLDIEGTTTPIDFVHKTLFPFAKAKIGKYVAENFDEIKTEISQLKTEYKKDFSNQIYGRNFREDAPESVAEYLKFLIEADRKSTPLKTLQGKIWQAGYESGELKSKVFEDVPRAFERWKSEGKTIVIYSSGSILAQRLLFGYTNFGDLTKYIDNYFDTNIGSKRERQGYEKITEKLTIRENEILFISDILEELNLAHEAGLNTILCVREGNSPIAVNHDYQTIPNFDCL